MKYLLALAFALSIAFITVHADAKCMYGSNWEKGGKKIIVCIHGDSFGDRHRGQAVCSKIKGSSCNTPSTFSSSCGNGQCYDASGNNHYSMSGY